MKFTTTGMINISLTGGMYGVGFPRNFRRILVNLLSQNENLINVREGGGGEKISRRVIQRGSFLSLGRTTYFRQSYNL